MDIYFNEKKLTITQELPSELKDAVHISKLNETELSGFWNGDAVQAFFVGDADETLAKLEKIYKPITAAGGVISNSENAILFIYRRGKWDLPKGKAEKHEAIEETALREVEEETGLSCELNGLLHITYHMYELKGKTILKRTYWYSMQYKGVDLPVPQTEEDIEKTVWLKADELKVVYENTYATIEDVLNHL